jgi:lipoprotein-anchoring transpeptidase ErfK/SrfK
MTGAVGSGEGIGGEEAAAESGQTPETPESPEAPVAGQGDGAQAGAVDDGAGDGSGEPAAEASAEDAPADEAPAEDAAEPAAEPETAAQEPVAAAEVVAEGAEAAEAPSEDAQETVVAAAAAATAVSAAAAYEPPPAPPAYAAAGAGPEAADGHGFDRRKVLLVGGVGVIVVGGAVAAFAATGSSGTQNSAAAQNGGSGATGAAGVAGDKSASASPSPTVAPATITTSPVDGATGVDPSKPITVQVLNGTIESVAFAGQGQTSGTMSTDGGSWTSSGVLSVDTGYQFTVIAKNSAGKSSSSTVSFHTLEPSMTFGVSSVVPPRGSTVGVGQPIRVTFSDYVPTEYQAALEKACVVTTNPPVKGAWYWVSNSEDGAVVDWRPENFWAVNTTVSIAFNLDGVRLGDHQYGTENYRPTHDFTISSRDLRLLVDKDSFKATCYQNGEVIRTWPISTGMTTAETFVTYTGTMAVLGKGNPVDMVGNYGPGDSYNDLVNWATQVTWSGTYVHAAPWDPDMGSANDDSHGCIHCPTVDAEWFYGRVVDGDVVTVTGSRTRPVAVDNGICTFTLDWSEVVKGSAYGPTLNGAPTSA